MRMHREGRISLRTHVVEELPAPQVSAAVIRRVREQLNLSRAVFARCLRVSARTLESWEQGRARPNSQAAALILLVQKFPDTLQRLTEIGAPSR